MGTRVMEASKSTGTLFGILFIMAGYAMVSSHWKVAFFILAASFLMRQWKMI